MLPLHIVTGIVAICVTATTSILAVIPQDFYGAVGGFLIAVTVLIHTVIAEKTRRQAKRIRPRVQRNERRIGRAESDIADAIATRDAAIERLNHRVEELVHIIDTKLDEK